MFSLEKKMYTQAGGCYLWCTENLRNSILVALMVAQGTPLTPSPWAYDQQSADLSGLLQSGDIAEPPLVKCRSCEISYQPRYQGHFYSTSPGATTKICPQTWFPWAGSCLSQLSRDLPFLRGTAPHITPVYWSAQPISPHPINLSEGVWVWEWARGQWRQSAKWRRTLLHTTPKYRNHTISLFLSL